MGLLVLIILLMMFLILIWPWIQERQRNRVTTGVVIATELRTYTGKYGKRYTRKFVTFEFQDEQGKTWRGQITGDRTLSIPEGTSIQVHYQAGQPSNNRGALPQQNP